MTIEPKENVRSQFTKYRMLARVLKKDRGMPINEIAHEFEKLIGRRMSDNGLRIMLNNMIDLGMIKKVKVDIPSGTWKNYNTGFIRLVDIPDRTGKQSEHKR